MYPQVDVSILYFFLFLFCYTRSDGIKTRRLTTDENVQESNVYTQVLKFEKKKPFATRKRMRKKKGKKTSSMKLENAENVRASHEKKSTFFSEILVEDSGAHTQLIKILYVCCCIIQSII